MNISTLYFCFMFHVSCFMFLSCNLQLETRTNNNDWYIENFLYDFNS